MSDIEYPIKLLKLLIDTAELSVYNGVNSLNRSVVVVGVEFAIVNFTLNDLEVLSMLLVREGVQHVYTLNLRNFAVVSAAFLSLIFTDVF